MPNEKQDFKVQVGLTKVLKRASGKYRVRVEHIQEVKVGKCCFSERIIRNPAVRKNFNK